MFSVAGKRFYQGNHRRSRRNESGISRWLNSIADREFNIGLIATGLRPKNTFQPLEFQQLHVLNELLGLLWYQNNSFKYSNPTQNIKKEHIKRTARYRRFDWSDTSEACLLKKTVIQLRFIELRDYFWRRRSWLLFFPQSTVSQKRQKTQ